MVMCTINTNCINSHYGTDNGKKLRTVIVHSPQIDNEAEPLIKSSINTDNLSVFNQEHTRLCTLLRDCNVNVLYLNDIIEINRDIVSSLPDLTLLGNDAVICNKGACLSRLYKNERKNEEFVIKEALHHMSIPIIQEFYNNFDYFQGFVPFDTKTIFLTTTINHEHDSILQFIQYILIYFEEVVMINVPEDPRFDTADSIFNKIKTNCIMMFDEAIRSTTLYRRYYSKEINLVDYLRQRCIDYICISDQEQKQHACSFLRIDDERIIQYDSVFEERTRYALMQRGINILPFNSAVLSDKSSALSSYFLPVFRE